jgi:hypothetical protein
MADLSETGRQGGPTTLYREDTHTDRWVVVIPQFSS